MKALSILTVLLIGFTALASLGAAEKQKHSDLADYPFWTMKKRGYVAQFVPGFTRRCNFGPTLFTRRESPREKLYCHIVFTSQGLDPKNLKSGGGTHFSPPEVAFSSAYRPGFSTPRGRPSRRFLPFWPNTVLPAGFPPRGRM